MIVHRKMMPVRRFAFTLVEMLVALVIIIALAAMTAAILPRAMDQQKSSRAADQVMRWLLIAKQWAQVDQRPRGVRFTPDQNGYAWTAQYIQLPEDYIPQTANGICSLSVGQAAPGTPFNIAMISPPPHGHHSTG